MKLLAQFKNNFFSPEYIGWESDDQGTVTIVDFRTVHSMQLLDLSATIWLGIQKGHSAQDIYSTVTHEFEIEQNEAEQLIHDFLRQCLNSEMIREA